MLLLPPPTFKHLMALALAVATVCGSTAASAQNTSAARATDLRADKLPNAEVLAPVAAGSALRLVSLEGGWAYVEQAGQLGWVRASSLNLQAGSSAVSGVNSGRLATGGSINAALTLGVRSLPPRSNRHALIIGVSQYADPGTPPLPGARIDRESATQMASAMQVPASNIKYLQDSQATGDNIRKALADLNDRVQDGDRVFVHYSGHGTRYNDPNAGGCVEALLAYDGGMSGTITNREMSDLLKPITQKTDKLFVMYDACHSGGLVANTSPLRTRGMSNSQDEGALRPKFSSISEECGRPVNVKSRNLLVEQVSTGALPQDVVHVSASRDNEISFDDERKGGLATQFMRDCMLREAKDLDGSGAISMDEIRQCARWHRSSRSPHRCQRPPRCC
jgi:Caspase domain